MKIVDRKTVISNVGDTRTVQHYSTLLGEKPHKLGVVATMYPELTITALTDALRNVYFNPKSSASNFTPINAMAVRWDIDVNYIMKVYIQDTVTIPNPGKNKKPFSIVLDRKYYSKNDTFTFEDKQQALVIAPPQQLGAKRWSHQVIMVGNDYSREFNPTYLRKGCYTRFR